ncbi:cytochrome-c peroxidase [Lacipirellula sp.]|uniref:cytochrome-c peroxidase n=1 Tax=Lacipirellula sp. TaxID=2691419 RepID=UPI003D144DAB
MTRYRVSAPAAFVRSAALVLSLVVGQTSLVANAQAVATPPAPAAEPAKATAAAATREATANANEASADVGDATAAPAPQRRPLPPTVLRRLPRRLERTDDERKELAAQLREIYRKTPSTWPAPTVDAGVKWQEIGLLPEVQHPEDNPFSNEKVELGKMLFFDPRVSGSGQMACASCHDPDLGWGDGRTTSFGMDRKPLDRNAPSLMNAAYHTSLFWDGRAESLEDQAQQVLLNQDEMRSAPADLSAKLGAIPGYHEKFTEVFGPAEAGGEVIDIDRVTKALACFERTITGGRTPFDHFLKGRKSALSDDAILGLDLFRREARCMNCHYGPLMADGEFHEVGLSYYGRKYEDLGRYAVTGETEDVGKFRTPSLRSFAKSGPYMHNGLFPTARGVLNMYNVGMPTIRRHEHQLEDPLFPKKSSLLKPLGLNNQDLSDLEAFLEAASEPYLRMRPPELPPAESQETAAK